MNRIYVSFYDAAMAANTGVSWECNVPLLHHRSHLRKKVCTYKELRYPCLKSSNSHHLFKQLLFLVLTRLPLVALHKTSISIWNRSVSGVIEYAQGKAGCLFRDELFFNICDAVLMLAVTVELNVSQPEGQSKEQPQGLEVLSANSAVLLTKAIGEGYRQW